MSLFSRRRKVVKQPETQDGVVSDEGRQNRRSLMALLSGVAALGVAKKASAQQPSTLSNLPYASTPLSGSELTYIVQGGVSKKTPLSTIGGTGGPGGANGQLQYNNAGAFGGLGVGSGLSVVAGNLTAVGATVTGMPVATSVGAVQALTGSAGASVFLNSGGRSGILSFSTANHSVDVTNDPGQGEWIAPASDTTGASGAWVRQFSGRADFGWWGWVDDATFTRNDTTWLVSAAAGTDNNQAIVNWQTWARHQSALGYPVYMVMTPRNTGAMGWILSPVLPGLVGGYYWTSGIKNLDIDFGNCTLQQLGNAVSALSSFPIPHLPTLSQYLIQTTTPQAFTFTMVTAADSLNFYVGQKLLMTSFSILPIGFPPNTQYTQYVTVKAINTSTGVITTNEPILFQNRSDFPDFIYGGGAGVFNAGVARVWVVDGIAGPFSIRHTYRNVTVNLPQNQAVSTYISIGGDSVTFINYRGPGFSPSILNYGRFEDCSEEANGEIDKWVFKLEYTRHKSQNIGVSIQSASPVIMNIEGGIFGGLTGSPQRLSARGATFLTFGLPGAKFGLCGPVLYDDCVIGNPLGIGQVTDGTFKAIIDGVFVTYANSIITINLLPITQTAGAFIVGVQYTIVTTGTTNFTLIGAANSNPGTVFVASGSGSGTGTATGSYLSQENVNVWFNPPGTQLVLQALASDGQLLFSGDVGWAVILSVTTDSQSSPTVIRLATTLPATLPTWANNTIYFLHSGPVEFRQCTGFGDGDIIRLASDALAKGHRYFDYYSQVISGDTANPYSTGLQFQMLGILQETIINVVNPHPTSGATLAITFRTYNHLNNFTVDAGFTVLTINIGVAGKRVVNLAGFTGKAGTDSLTVGGVAANAFALRTLGFVITASITAAGASPCLIRWSIETDNGLSRATVTSTVIAGNIGTILPVLGSLQ